MSVSPNSFADYLKKYCLENNLEYLEFPPPPYGKYDENAPEYIRFDYRISIEVTKECTGATKEAAFRNASDAICNTLKCNSELDSLEAKCNDKGFDLKVSYFESENGYWLCTIKAYKIGIGSSFKIKIAKQMAALSILKDIDSSWGSYDGQDVDFSKDYKSLVNEAVAKLKQKVIYEDEVISVDGRIPNVYKTTCKLVLKQGDEQEIIMQTFGTHCIKKISTQIAAARMLPNVSIITGMGHYVSNLMKMMK